jgi:hypothetical protein
MSTPYTVEAVYLATGENPGDTAPAYALAYSTDREGTPDEKARVQFGWNEAGLQVFAELEDSHIIACNPQDEQLHYEHGDVLELFVKPLEHAYKWEMYATPTGNKSTLFFPESPANMTPLENLTHHKFRDLEVTAKQTSIGWNTHLFVPVAQLTALGAGWGDGTEWTVFCGRYNYHSTALTNPELSMFPPLSATNYHLTEEYARLSLLPA